MVPCITRPTRVTNSSATLIDNIYVTAGFSKEAFSGILLSDISDHFPVFVVVGNRHQNTSKESLIFKSRSFCGQAFTNMERYLSQLNWTFRSNIELNYAYSKCFGEQ